MTKMAAVLIYGKNPSKIFVTDEKVKVSKNKEKAQAERDSHSKNLGGGKTKYYENIL